MAERDRWIVVGVDGSDESDAALGWALEEAKLRRTNVRVVHAWFVPVSPAPMGVHAPEVANPEPFREAAERLLSELTAKHAASAGGVGVETVAVQGSPAGVLVDAAAGAEMLVVGSRGRGGFASLLLGSVSQQCAHHARCPVVIVRRPG